MERKKFISKPMTLRQLISIWINGLSPPIVINCIYQYLKVKMRLYSVNHPSFFGSSVFNSNIPNTPMFTLLNTETVYNISSQHFVCVSKVCPLKVYVPHKNVSHSASALPTQMGNPKGGELIQRTQETRLEERVQTVLQDLYFTCRLSWVSCLILNRNIGHWLRCLAQEESRHRLGCWKQGGNQTLLKEGNLNMSEEKESNSQRIIAAP